MTEVEKLSELRKKISQAISLAKQELYKSEELDKSETEIYSSLKEVRPVFDDTLQRKIDKIIPTCRNMPKSGIYLKYESVENILKPIDSFIVELLESKTNIKPIDIPAIVTKDKSLQESIRDAKLLMDTNGTPNAVDRFHTLLQTYLREQNRKSNISYNKDDSVNILLKNLREKHSILLSLQSKEPEVVEILKGMSNTLDKLSTLRNQKSLAHGNGLMDIDEANFVIDAVNTILRYLTSKLGE